MCNDSSRQVGNEKSVPQIEVTPEMIEAGLCVLREELDWGDGQYPIVADEELVTAILRAALRSRDH